MRPVQIPSLASPRPAPVFSLDQPWQEKQDPNFRPAEVRMKWAADRLVIEAVLQDDEVFSQATRHNQKMWELGDVLEFFVQVEGRADYLEMHVTPSNHRLHLRLPGVGGRTQPEAAPLTFEEMLVSPPGFSSSVEKTTTGWAVRAEIPVQALALTELTPGTALRVSFSRYDAAPHRRPVLSTTANHPVIAFHRPEEWTKLVLE
jgi:hypothetical protein